MASAEELRTSISAGQAALREAIAGAGEVWEQAPEGGEGEDSWSPRQAAEHVIGSEVLFVGAIAGAIDQAKPERAELALASTEEALAALTAAVEVSARVYAAVTDDDLAKEAGGGNSTVESMMGIHAGHGADHAQQIASVS